MSTILNFPTKYPPRQWRMRRKIAAVAAQLGLDAEDLLWGDDEAGRPRSWFDQSDEALNGLWDTICQERMKKQHTDYLETVIPPRGIEKEAEKTKKAVILHFPVSDETRARIEQRNALKKKAAALKKSKTGRAKPAAAMEKTNAAARKKLMVKVQVAKKQLIQALPEFSDQTYRFILEMKFNKTSSKDLTGQELHELLLHFQELGWQQKVGKEGRAATVEHPLLYHDPTGLGRDRQMQKIQALLLEKGNIEDRAISFQYALAILKRQTGGVVTSFDNASPVHLKGVITALARHAERKGSRAQ